MRVKNSPLLRLLESLEWEHTKVNWHFVKKAIVLFGQNADFHFKTKLTVDKYVQKCYNIICAKA